MTGISHQPTLHEAAVWRGFTRRALDRAYDNAGAVVDSASHLVVWRERSAALRAMRPALLDRRYGARERNGIDIFRCGAPGAPLFVFIHGGYWQRNSKEGFSCMAEGPLAHGFDVALLGYTLGPEASLSEIAAEIAMAIAWLRQHGSALDVARGKLIVGGWSAGGHLAALACGLPGVDGGLLISGIYDLEPIRHGILNDKLHLTDQEIERLSPIRNPAPRAPATVVYGSDELAELRRQSEDYARVSQLAGAITEVRAETGANHFSILDRLMSPDGSITRSLVRLGSPR